MRSEIKRLLGEEAGADQEDQSVEEGETEENHDRPAYTLLIIKEYFRDKYNFIVDFLI